MLCENRHLLWTDLQYLLLLLIRMSKAKTTEGLRAPPALSPRQHQPLIPCDASCSFVSPSPPLAPSINCPAAGRLVAGGGGSGGLILVADTKNDEWKKQSRSPPPSRTSSHSCSMPEWQLIWGRSVRYLICRTQRSKNSQVPRTSSGVA